jgi:hypothetical protein
MTSAQQFLSFMLGSLFSRLGSLSHSNRQTTYERELDRSGSADPRVEDEAIIA